MKTPQPWKMSLFETNTTQAGESVLYVNPQQTWITDGYTFINPNHVTPGDSFILVPADPTMLQLDATANLLIPDPNAYPANTANTPAPPPFWAWCRENNLQVTAKPSTQGALFQAIYSGQVIAAAITDTKTGPSWGTLEKYGDDITRLAQLTQDTRLLPYESWWAAATLIWGQTKQKL